MRRRSIVAGLAACSIVPYAVTGQTISPRRIGYLTGGFLASRSTWLDAFRRRMSELGFRNGHDFVLDIRGAEGNFERLPSLLQELVAPGPSALLVSTTPASQAVKKAAVSLPTVFVAVGDPVGVGLVESLARPGGNFTGVSNLTLELGGKRLELLKEIMPTVRRVAILQNPDDGNSDLQLTRARTAADVLGLQLGPILDVRRLADLDRHLDDAVRSGVQAALRMVDPTVSQLREQIAALTLKHRLPSGHLFREEVQAGGLFAYGVDQAATYAMAAELMAKVLRGARPADLPVEQPTKLALFINLRTARALDVTVPAAVLARADEVIE